MATILLANSTTLDPHHDPHNPMRYIASNSLTGVAFGLVLITGLAQTWCLFRWPAKWMLSMVIGAYTFAFGLSMRFGLHYHPDSKGLYITEYLFVVLSPCAFIAADYVLLGRLARRLQSEKFLLVSPKRITPVFIASDITTFLIQAAGGALSISADKPSVNLTGSHIFLAGLALQLASFFTFSCIYLVFLYRLRRYSPEVFAMDNGKKWYEDWRALGGALFFSCVGILIRSVYRTIELSDGYLSHLATTESFFYGLDTLPLFIAIVVYIPFWPGRFIQGVDPIDEKESSSSL